ncbi:hypothetical protein HDU78_010911 [Chytriomyces hyalinus]|nr:hypothetical protein HDU78_010911 [Chytriomyces hyalinus]
MAELDREATAIAVQDIEADAPTETETPKKKGFASLFKRSSADSPAKVKEPAVPLLALFRFADAKDKAMIAVGFVFSVGIGALIPSAILILGQVLGNGAIFAGSSAMPALGSGTNANMKPPPFDPSSFYPMILNFVYFGLAMMVAGYVSQALWVLAGENQARRIRELYMQRLLRQDMAWFDMAEEGSLTTRLAQDTALIQDGISEKAGLCVQSIAQFITGFVIAFVKGPTLALVLLAAVPVMASVGIVMFGLLTKLTARGQDAYAEAGAVAEQVISGIRTIYSFSLQARFAVKYDQKLAKAEAADRAGGLTRGVGFGAFMLVMFSTYGLAFWYGSRLVLDGRMQGQDVLVSFMSLMMGSFALMMIPQNLAAVGGARGAAYKIFATIDRVPVIDSLSEKGETLGDLQGNIEFRGVGFKYPTRPDTVIFDNFNIKVEPGQTVAFVGPSGSGKSTTVQLIQRFYDPLAGSVHLDGVDLTKINVKWLRQQMGIVSQEPVLFNTTVKQNILMGAIEDSANPVTESELHSVCKMANCHNFIMDLPQGYDTMVGEHGGMLSGGQKQRIAIARALIKNPKILLLDEATSALDTHSERLVQHALDKASQNRTTIVIAHRLSTIKNADRIVVLDKGTIIETGTHNELLALNGVYFQLVEKQKVRQYEEGVLKTSDSAESVADDLIEVAASKVHVVESQTLEDSGTGKSIETRLTMGEVSHTQALEDARLAKKAEEQALLSKKAPIRRVFMLMKPEWGLVFLGVIGACGSGVIFPIFGLIFSTITTVLLVPSQIDPGPFQGANLYAFAFVLSGIGAFIFFSLQFYGFEMAGAALTHRLRLMTFKSMIRQEVGFYDDDRHSLGALTSRLAIDAARVGDLITKVWADATQLVVTAVCGITIGLVFSWKLTLIVLLVAPFMVVASYYESRVRMGFEDSTKKAYEESGTIAAEAFKEIRTVAALTRESYFLDKFSANLERPHQLALKKAREASLGNGVGQAFGQFASAVGFYAGVRLIEAGEVDFQSVFKVLMAVMFTAQGLGRGSTFAETFVKAKIAALNTFELIDRATLIDPEDDTKGLDDGSDIKGSFEFKNVAFTYPARPTVPIFGGEFKLSGSENKTIALVGPSGCGKSSAIGMLQRWYDVSGGAVTVDGKNVRDFQLKGLRSQMALVGQEPTLFDMSIRENILAGTEKTTVTDAELDEIAKMANIYDIIMDMPDKYDTRVGDKGSQLSGGQKQRVAIARALIRNPKILLLDEATSALDSESEKHVQQAIDNAIRLGGRTTITIAHRLSTIQNSDIIAVVKDGKIAEIGTHNELLGIKDGVYAALVRQQDLNLNKYQRKKNSAAAPAESASLQTGLDATVPSDDAVPSVYSHTPQPHSIDTINDFRGSTDDANEQHVSNNGNAKQGNRSIFNSFVTAMTTTAASIMANNENDLDNARRALADAVAVQRARSRSRSPTHSHLQPQQRAASPSSRALASPTRFDAVPPKIDRAASPSRMSSVFGMATRLFNPPAAQEVYANQPNQEYQFGVQEGQDFRYSLSDPQIDQNATQQAGNVYDQEEYSTQYSSGEQQQQYYDYSLQQATGQEYYPSDQTQQYHPDSYDYYNNDATYPHQQPHSYGQHQYGDQTGNYTGYQESYAGFQEPYFHEGQAIDAGHGSSDGLIVTPQHQSHLSWNPDENVQPSEQPAAQHSHLSWNPDANPTLPSNDAIPGFGAPHPMGSVFDEIATTHANHYQPTLYNADYSNPYDSSTHMGSATYPGEYASTSGYDVHLLPQTLDHNNVLASERPARSPSSLKNPASLPRSPRPQSRQRSPISRQPSPSKQHQEPPAPYTQRPASRQLSTHAESPARPTSATMASPVRPASIHTTPQRVVSPNRSLSVRSDVRSETNFPPRMSRESPNRPASIRTAESPVRHTSQNNVASPRISPIRPQSPNPFALPASHERRTSSEFPISGGLQTWPTSPTAINQSTTLNPSYSSLGYAYETDAAGEPSATNGAALHYHADAPVNGQSYPLYPDQASYNSGHYAANLHDSNVMPEAYISPTASTNSYNNTYTPNNQPEQPMIHIPNTLYTQLLTENDNLMRQQSATEEYINSLVAARATLETRCANLESERATVTQELQSLKQTVESFGDLQAQLGVMEARAREIEARERAVEMSNQRAREFMEAVERKEAALRVREDETVTQSALSADAHLRLRIQEVEESRRAVDVEKREVEALKAQVEAELYEAQNLKIESDEALKRVESSIGKVKEKEAALQRGFEELEEEKKRVEELRVTLESQCGSLESMEAAVKRMQEDAQTRSEELQYQYGAFDRDREDLESRQRAYEQEMQRLQSMKRSMDSQQSQLIEGHELLRQREAEVRSRQDEFLSQSSSMANREAVQLTELRREYDIDTERLQYAKSELEHQKMELESFRQEVETQAHEVREEKARLMAVKRELDRDQNILSQKAAEVEGAQASLTTQQQSLDEAVAAFTEMKEFISSSMKENDAHIKNEFDAIQKAHIEQKEREAASMKEIANERQLIAELQDSIEHERRLLMEKEMSLQGSVGQAIPAKLQQLEEENAELRSMINESSLARAQTSSHISELEESNRQLQKNVLHLTAMMESGNLKKPNQFTQSQSFVSDKSSEVDERFEQLEKKVDDMTRESMKESAEYHDFKQFLREAVPIIEELKSRKSGSPNSTGAKDRSHLWTRQEAETLQDAAAGASLSDNDYDKLVANKSSADLLNVIVSLTSTNQNLSRKLDETLSQIQQLQTKFANPASPHRKSAPLVALASPETPSTIASANSLQGNAPTPKSALSRRASGVSGVSDLYSSALETDSSANGEYGRDMRNQEEQGYYGSSETMSSYRNGSRDILAPPPNPTPRYSQHPAPSAPIYPPAKSMTKVFSNTTERHNRRNHAVVNDGYAESANSEFSENSAGKPSDARVPFSISTTPASQPMVRAPKSNQNDYATSSSPETPRATSMKKRSSALPASSTYFSNGSSITRDYFEGNEHASAASKATSTVFNKTSNGRPHSSAFERNGQFQGDSTNHGSGSTSSVVPRSKSSLLHDARRHPSLEGLRTYYTEKDLVRGGESSQRVMFGGESSGGNYGSASNGSAVRSSGSSNVHFAGASASSSAMKAKSDTEGVGGGWGSGGGRSALRNASSAGNRTESIRDLIRARIKERDMGNL